MNPVEHLLYLYSPTGELLTIIRDGAWIDLSYGFRENERGVLELTLPGDFERRYLAIDGMIEVYRSYGNGTNKLEGDTAFFMRKPIISTAMDGTKTIHVTAYSAADLLKRRVIPYYAGSSYTEKMADHWDDMLREIMRENYGTLASDTARNLSPWLSIEPDQHYGASYQRSKPLAECDNIAPQGPRSCAFATRVTIVNNGVAVGHCQAQESEGCTRLID